MEITGNILMTILENLSKKLTRPGIIGINFLEDWEKNKGFFKKYKEYKLINSSLKRLENENKSTKNFFVDFYRAQIKTNIENLKEKIIREEKEKKKKEEEEKKKKKEEEEAKKKKEEEEAKKKKEEEEAKKKKEEEEKERKPLLLDLIKIIYKEKNIFNIEEMVKGMDQTIKEVQFLYNKDLNENLNAFRAEIAMIKKDNQEVKDKIEKLTEENKEKETRIEKLENENKEIKKENKEKETRIKRLENENKEKETRIKKLENENKEKEDKISELRGENLELNKNLKDVQGIVIKMREEERKNKEMLKKCFIRDIFKKVLKEIENKEKEKTDLKEKYQNYKKYLLKHKWVLNEEIHGIQFSQVNDSTYNDNLLGHVAYSMDFYNDLSNKTQKEYLDLTKEISSSLNEK